MSIRLDPRRLGALKQLAGEAGMRPGDLVRGWVEERIDAARQGVPTPAAATDLAARLDALADRVAALEGSGTGATRNADDERDEPTAIPVASDASDAPAVPAPPDDADAADETEPSQAVDATVGADDGGTTTRRRPARKVTAAPRGERVALHDEMIAVLGERGPMTAGDLAAVIVERGRYAPPRSGKPLDAAMVSQRVSNPTYRARFTRNEGRIGLAERDGDA